MAEQYPLGPSRDGVQRLTVKIEHRLTLHDVAVCLVVAKYGGITPEVSKVQNELPTKFQVMQEVKKALGYDSLSRMQHELGSESGESPFQAIVEYLARVWKERLW